MNNVLGAVIRTFAAEWERRPYLEGQSRRDDLKVAQDVSPGKAPWQFGQSRRDG